MRTRVDLQDMLSYNIFFLVLLLALIAIIAVVFFLFKIFLKKRPPKVVPVKKENIDVARGNALEKIQRLIESYQNGFLPRRIAYQDLSIVVRKFVQKATRINVQNYTLEEIGALEMPDLYTLISECYDPEFMYHSEGDFVSTANKASEVIRKWN